jgi:CheY-like chemotaxis protein
MATILIVEDEQSIARLLQEILEDQGYSVGLASNGKEALERLADLTPQVVVSDVMMPILGGVGLCHSLQSNPSYQHIPVILMSAGHEQHVSNCEYTAFLSKPFQVDDLLNLVERVVAIAG